MKRLNRVALTAVAVETAAGAVWAYVKWVRPWQTTWGATLEEVSRAYPYDDVFQRPDTGTRRGPSP